MRRVMALLTLAMLNGGGQALAQNQERITDPQVYQYLQAGIGFIGQNKFGNAAEQFKLALAKDPHCGAAQINLGLALIHEGKFEEAQPILVKATEDHPTKLRPGSISAPAINQRGKSPSLSTACVNFSNFHQTMLMRRTSGA